MNNSNRMIRKNKLNFKTPTIKNEIKIKLDRNIVELVNINDQGDSCTKKKRTQNETHPNF